MTANYILSGGYIDQAPTGVGGTVETLAGTLSLTTTSALGATAGNTLDVTAPISGTGPLQINGGVDTNGDTGVVSLNGSNTYTGSTTISAGTLALGSAGSLGSGGTYSGAIAISSGAMLNDNSSASQFFTGAMSGSGGLTVNAGQLSLGGTATYTGATVVNGGTLTLLKNASNTPTISYLSPIAINSGGFLRVVAARLFDAGGTGVPTGNQLTIANGGTLYIDGAASTTARIGLTSLTMTGGTVTGVYSTNAYGGLYANNINISANATPSLISNVRLYGTEAASGSASPLITFNVGSNAQCNVSSPITDFTGTSSGQATQLTLTGSGLLVLSGSNTYTGATTLSGGTLQLVANAGNTNSGAVATLMSNSVANTLGNGATLQLRSDSSLTFAGGNNVQGLGNGTFTFDVNQVTAGNTNNTISFAPAGFNTYTEQLNVTGGNGYTLSIGSIVGDTSPLTLNPTTANLTVGGLAGVTSLTKSGTGILTLTGTSTYSGNTTVNAGNLYVNGLSASSAITVGSSATLGGQGTVGPTTIQAGGILEGGQGGTGTLTLGSLTFSNSATINLTPSGIAAIDVTGGNGLTASGGSASVAINIGTATLGAGTYPLIAYSGSIQGSAGFAAFSIGTQPTDSNIYTLKNVSGDIDLFVAVNAPYWTGANGTAWDTSTVNWQVDGTPSTYGNGLAVVFDDSAGTNGTVVISGTDVSPASVTFNNSALPYTLQGTNAITGSTGLTKGGTASLTIANINDFTGAVTFNGGTIAVGTIAVGGVNSPLGAGTSLVFGGGTLEYTGTDSAPATDRAITLNFGGGTFQVDNAGTMLTLSGSIGGVGGLTASGPGSLTLSNTSNSFAGNVTVNGGTLAVLSIANSGVNIALGSGSTVTLGGATLEYAGTDADTQQQSQRHARHGRRNGPG